MQRHLSIPIGLLSLAACVDRDGSSAPPSVAPPAAARTSAADDAFTQLVALIRPRALRDFTELHGTIRAHMRGPVASRYEIRARLTPDEVA